jgi:hypothetical protein
MGKPLTGIKKMTGADTSESNVKVNYRLNSQVSVLLFLPEFWTAGANRVQRIKWQSYEEACVGFEVITPVVTNVAIFWDTVPCSPYVD